MLIEIRAHFECDGCGKPFSVRIDAAGKTPDGWTPFDEAVNAVRGSLDYEGPRTPLDTPGCSSVQNDKCLCGDCTYIEDQKGGA